MPTLEELKQAIEASWGSDTCFDASEWTSGNPARGHCVVTSLVVQYFFGGDLLKVVTVFNGHDESHYYNLLPDGSTLDWTRQQYPADQPLTPSVVNLRGFANARDKMLHEEHTRQRYELLLERAKRKLAG